MSSILLVVKMVSRLGSYQTKDNATNNPSTRQHRPLWGMPRKQMQALASLRAHHKRVYKKRNLDCWWLHRC